MFFKGRDIVSAGEFTTDEIDFLMQEAAKIRSAIREKDPKGYKFCEFPDTLVGTAFFEDSTRTNLSFQRACQLLGVQTLGFAGSAGTSIKKGESLGHTLEMLAEYGAEVIVMRHSLDGSARWAVETMKQRAEREGTDRTPIFNAGDGKHEHPTQLLLDRFALLHEFDRLDPEKKNGLSLKGKTILMSGDLKYGRVPHSDVKNFAKDGVHFIFVSPKEFQMPESYLQIIRESDSTFETASKLEDKLVAKADALFAFRFQKERYGQVDSGLIEQATRDCRLTVENTSALDENARIFHPLPIYKHDPEISPDIDRTKFAAYFRQAGGGVPTRLAELAMTLDLIGKEFDGKVFEQPVSGNVYWREAPLSPNGEDEVDYKLQPVRGNGIAIDRVPPETVPKLIEILKLGQEGRNFRIAQVNPDSNPKESKVKIAMDDYKINDREKQIIGAVCGREEGADGKPLTINRIVDGRVTEKQYVFVPPVIEGLGTCTNITRDHTGKASSGCISRPEFSEHTTPKFIRAGPGLMRCAYCDELVEGKYLI